MSWRRDLLIAVGIVTSLATLAARLPRPMDHLEYVFLIAGLVCARRWQRRGL